MPLLGKSGDERPEARQTLWICCHVSCQCIHMHSNESRGLMHQPKAVCRRLMRRWGTEIMISLAHEGYKLPLPNGFGNDYLSSAHTGRPGGSILMWPVKTDEDHPSLENRKHFFWTQGMSICMFLEMVILRIFMSRGVWSCWSAIGRGSGRERDQRQRRLDIQLVSASLTINVYGQLYVV